ncbi:hypothetical protein [Pseudoalteromonas sp.]|uniref:hypothetical protein n=1 Tax=Pseudoalteromonas sp. TaxID=53249 RepID=UPI001BD0B28C|nr:hypothetical protein [Pseudoalteromonas sp.]
MNRSTFSIIGERYLDTQHDDEYIQGLESELKLRGVTGLYRWLLEYIAASSLWWNVLWWDWCDLNERDVKIGWTQNLVVFGLASVAASFIFSLTFGVGVFLALHILTTWLGFGLRSGTKLNKQRQGDA